MKKLFSLAAGLGMALCATAQSGTIIGTLIVQDRTAAPAATLSLLRAKDSGLVKAAQTEPDGRFQFEKIKPGQYLLLASAVGYQPVYSKPLAVGEGPVAAGELYLQPADKSIKGVTVTARKPFVEQRLDKMIVHVDANISNAGSTALEVLEKSPGITVDKDGNISLKGKTGVRIYVDGRPSYLSGAELANLLRSMPAAQLDQLEIMTNPPAKYDAAGNAGVINIKLKRTKMPGFSGSITTGFVQGQVPRFNQSANFNYRKDKLTLYGNASYNNNRQIQEIIIQRNFRNKDTKELLSVFDQRADLRNNRQYLDLRLGADYAFSKKTTAGILVSGFHNPEKVNNLNSNYLSNQLGQMQMLTTATSVLDNRWQNFSANLSLRHIFDSTGRELTVDADYSHYLSRSKQQLSNNYFTPAGTTMAPGDTLIGNIPSAVRIFSAKADYAQPLAGKGRLEAGIKMSAVKTDNDARYDSLINNRLVNDRGRSNHFVYEEQIQAAYLNINRPLSKKWELQTGLRLENTIAKGRQITTRENFTRNYLQLFPTLYIGYKMNAANTFTVNYGRRIERPDYGDLNPFFFFLDRYTYMVGNPQLSPEFAHTIELGHSYKGIVNTTINYSKTTDLIQDIFEQDEIKQETFVKKVNLASREQLGIAVNTGFSPQKWLSLNLYSNLSHNRFKGFINNADVSITNTMLTANLSAQFNLGKGWKATADGFYRGKGLEGVLVINPLWAANAGISKSVLKNKGTLRLTVRDIFWSQRFKGTANYAYIDTWFRQVRDSRQAGINFTYRFGKGKPAAPRRKIGGADEEKGRVKTGG